MSETFYTILGVSDKASADEIKKAYRSLQMKYHPDKNMNSPESNAMTQKINEAYETLSDSSKRQQYDMRHNNPFAQMHMSQQMPPQMDDIFKMFFGGQGGMPGGPGIQVFHNGQPILQKPAPIIKTININIEQVLTGTSVPIEVERWIIENGNKVFEKETIYITIPQGIDEHEIIILRDKGNVLNDNMKGDIKIFLKITNESEFKRMGLDLIYEKKISLKDSLCGFSFELKYLNNKSYTLNNNKGNIIPSDYKKIYPEMGLTRGEHKGNMIIHFHVEFPETLTEEQIAKISEFL